VGWAGTVLARALHRIPPQPLRVAFFLRSNSNLYEQVGGRLIAFRYFDLMLPLAAAVAQLNDFQPDIVVGPPSLLGMLAAARGSNALRIRPERLISVAEVLEPQDRERIVAGFDAPVHQIYQCTEGLLAVSCAQGGLHIQEDLVTLQLDPLPGSTGQDGERVTPIVTDLWRRTQPIIRYRLNDVLRLDPAPCACGSGFRVIRAVEGRCDDLCYFTASGGGVRPFFPDTIRRMVLLASAEIEDYQCVQERQGQMRIHVRLAPGAHLDTVAAAVRASVAVTVAQYECLPAEVEIEEGVPPPPAGAKRRRVIRAAEDVPLNV
jgi:phenylacetate-CoA ligase